MTPTNPSDPIFYVASAALVGMFVFGCVLAVCTAIGMVRDARRDARRRRAAAEWAAFVAAEQNNEHDQQEQSR